MVRVFRSFVWMLVALLPCGCVAQAGATDDPTVHVYVNRIQIPVLVLSQYGRPMRPIPEGDFRILLNGVGAFKPTHARLEGDDPLAVAVIVDASDPSELIWRDLPKAVDRLLPMLHSEDRLLLYGTDGCMAHRFVPENAVLNASLIRAGVVGAMNMKAHLPPKATKSRTTETEQPSPCPHGLTMADMVHYVAVTLSSFPGRRMIVTVGAGNGSGYAGSMDALKQTLNAKSIMLVPVVHDAAYAAMPIAYVPHLGAQVGVVNPGVHEVYADLAELSEFSGGRVQYISTQEFPKSLADAVTLARGRYILEFPRPDKLAAGHYQISVTDGHLRDFIRTPGISVPVANAEEIAAARAEATAAATATPDVQASPAAIAPQEQTPVERIPPRVADQTPVVRPAAPPPPAVTMPAAAPDLTDITVDLKPTR